MSKQLSDRLTDFEKEGFILLKSMIPNEQLDQLTDEIEAASNSRHSAGIRNLLSLCEAVRLFANSGAPYDVASTILKTIPRPVRAILFDKTAESNWYVTWHQDLTIPVKSRVNIDGYGPWSTKDGILHVQPPASILENMVSLRIHLDACSENNGAIKFIAASHNDGVLDRAKLAHFRDNSDQISCPAERGDIIAMRPLILHSSSTSDAPEHRRVLHLEYAGTDLPAEMEWAQA
jgi:Phytanoyl-CoA dioxygenase (PhyH)